MEADICDEETEAYVTNLSYYHLVPFETDILEWGADPHGWTCDAIMEGNVLLDGTMQRRTQQPLPVNAAAAAAVYPRNRHFVLFSYIKPDHWRASRRAC